jgi:very-short-patch-repair endonuclease
LKRPSELIDRNQVVLLARQLRRTQTLPEGLLWRVLQDRPGGLKFRRQHPLGWYVVDFYCPSASLIIEVDGQSHSMGDRPRHDSRRDDWLKRQGLRILRVSAVDVMRDLQSVVTEIQLACRG